jgi:serine/threonine-protein kinase HipA
MSVNGKFSGFTQQDLLVVADRFAIGTASRVIDQVRKAIKAWPRYASEAGVRTKQMQHIESLLLPLVYEQREMQQRRPPALRGGHTA